ncbi:CSC1-like protein [Hibiscus syriacus]|uniref:CSC1-like protein n=1 Tax=Hibiscus syriacus TaxID=106335 RepID=A0A6A2ZU92_HIBSY|nr:CSC1-like protein [Hibiscus syriacus]
MNDTLPPPPSPSSDEDFPIDGACYGNIPYLLNISTVGLLCCVLIFLFLKLRSDHRRIPGPSALFSKLLGVWHATGREIARHCGADASQYLLIEGGSFSVLLSVAVLAVFVSLPGLPKNIVVDKGILLEYFQYRYPGKDTGSPLAVITAVQSAAWIITAEAIDHAQSWLAWVQSSSWMASLIFQFLPNVIIFVSMYIIGPSVLSHLSKFERHLTVSGEQRAALLKMVCFFLVNLILLKALVESSLESAILLMGRCYLDGEDCKRIEQYMSASFLSRYCLSSLAFLITSTFLGISYDLLAPVPWIKKKLQKFRKNDMLQLVPDNSEE